MRRIRQERVIRITTTRALTRGRGEEQGREGREKKRKGSEREEEVYKRQAGWKGECAL